MLQQFPDVDDSVLHANPFSKHGDGKTGGKVILNRYIRCDVKMT